MLTPEVHDPRALQLLISQLQQAARVGISCSQGSFPAKIRRRADEVFHPGRQIEDLIPQLVRSMNIDRSAEEVYSQELTLAWEIYLQQYASCVNSQEICQQLRMRADQQKEKIIFSAQGECSSYSQEGIVAKLKAVREWLTGVAERGMAMGSLIFGEGCIEPGKIASQLLEHSQTIHDLKPVNLAVEPILLPLSDVF